MTESLSARRNALVTGANTGIGRAIALGLAEAGIDIVVHHLGDDDGARSVAETVASAGRKAETLELDLADIAAVHQVADDLAQGVPKIDVLILNAAIEERSDWRSLNQDSIQRHVAVNFASGIVLMQSLVPQMARRGWGRVVAVGSILAERPRSETLVYASLKSAQLTALRSIARSVAADGVTVNVVSPGSILTERSRATLSDDTVRAAVERKIPAGRIGHPEDCVAPVRMLCSDAAAYITGANIPVDGGWHIGDAMEASR
jgi:NAD(P)-dependent dehydrogenase (short-subunit alcohol dehydrogenase family)